MRLTENEKRFMAICDYMMDNPFKLVFLTILIPIAVGGFVTILKLYVL